MADIVAMARPKLQNKDSRTSMLRPLAQQRIPRGAKRRSKTNLLSKGDGDDWASDIASSIEYALGEKMVNMCAGMGWVGGEGREGVVGGRAGKMRTYWAKAMEMTGHRYYQQYWIYALREKW